MLILEKSLVKTKSIGEWLIYCNKVHLTTKWKNFLYITTSILLDKPSLRFRIIKSDQQLHAVDASTFFFGTVYNEHQKVCPRVILENISEFFLVEWTFCEQNGLKAVLMVDTFFDV